MSQFRQLAAIMFTDIVGYTTLMGNDEQNAFILLNKNRQLQKPIIAAFDGRWIKETGDGTIASFNTVSDAVNAAIKIQEICNAANDFQLRIGIHLGEVVFESDDVFGDGVNIAARIQSIAHPGSIYISESVHSNISNKRNFQTKFVKEERLKNVKDPVKIYQIIAEGVVAASQLQIGLTIKPERKALIIIISTIMLLIAAYFIKDFFATQKNYEETNYIATDKSIAVLPFVDMTQQGDMEYLGDGLAEEIINSLTSIRDLKVIGRTSSFQFKGEKLDLRDIGEKLQVSIILEGSIQKFEDHLRITAQLVRTKDNFHIWSERYDLKQTNIFKIQDNIASNIVDKLELTLTSMEQGRIVKREINQEAYNLYLKGLYQYKAEKFDECIPFLNRVIQLDSTFAPAYAYMGLSKAWITYKADRGLDTKAVNEASFYALRSIELDPDLAEGYSANGLISWTLQRDYAKARFFFEKSIEVNPAPAPSYILNRYGYLLVWMGDFEKASQLALKAMKLDPVDYNSYTVLYFASLYAGRLDEAERNFNERNRIFGQDRTMVSMEIRLNLAQGNFKKVIKQCDSLVSSGASLNALELSQLSISYFKLNRLPESETVFKQLKAMVADQSNEACFPTALIFADRHEIDSCFFYLQIANQRREQVFRTFKIEPALKDLHKDPRYIKLYQDSGFDKY